MVLSLKLCYLFLLVVEISASRDFQNFSIIQKMKYQNSKIIFFHTAVEIWLQQNFCKGLTLESESWTGNSSNLFRQKSKDLKKFNR